MYCEIVCWYALRQKCSDARAELVRPLWSVECDRICGTPSAAQEPRFQFV
jgi:hypothetical protein